MRGAGGGAARGGQWAPAVPRDPPRPGVGGRRGPRLKGGDAPAARFFLDRSCRSPLPPAPPASARPPARSPPRRLRAPATARPLCSPGRGNAPPAGPPPRPSALARVGVARPLARAPPPHPAPLAARGSPSRPRPQPQAPSQSRCPRQPGISIASGWRTWPCGKN